MSIFTEVQLWEGDCLALAQRNFSPNKALEQFRQHLPDVRIEDLQQDWCRWGFVPDEYGLELKKGYYTPATPGRGAFRVWLVMG